MKKKRLPTLRYYFSVEGETESLYLDWLNEKINEIDSCCVKFDIKVEKSPLARTRQLSIIQETDVWHFCDYESPDPEHIRQFKKTIDEMREAGKHKQVRYHLGYSNFAFDLWIILHKKACNGAKAHRRQYIAEINSAFHERFENMDQYKHKNNFKRCLAKISLDDVKMAIARSKTIMKNHIDRGSQLQKYRGYSYYADNPSLAVHEIIENILIDCGLD